MNNNKTSELTKNTLLLSIATILTKGLQFVMVPLFSSWLSTEDYGTFDLLVTYITLLIPVVTLASTDSIFRFTIDNKKNEKKYITNGLFIYTLNIIITIIIASLLNIHFKWSLIIPFIVLLISRLMNDYFQGFMRGIRKLKLYSFFMAISTLLIAICTTIFIKALNMKIDGILYGYALGYIIANILVIVSTKFWKYIATNSISRKTCKEMIKYSFPLVFNNISWWIVNVSDRSIINIFLGTTMNGIYAIANKVPSLASSIFGVFSISWQQTASEIVDTKDRNQFFIKVYNKSVSILLSLCIGILSINFILFDFIFDSKYELARYHAPILVFSIIFLSISQFLGGIQISLKRPKANGITTVISAIVNITVHLSLIKFIGLYAASISTLVSNLVLVFLRIIKIRDEVILKLDNKNKMYFLIFIYYFVIQYLINIPILLEIINVIIACILFTIINKDFIKKFSNRLMKRKS